ncbi:hypothetical protein BGZ94_001167 [Podila epigama]|nr:hypothetical protein BGZ94_001167 [Podila epigama]
MPSKPDFSVRGSLVPGNGAKANPVVVANSTITIKILDVSLADAPSVTLGKEIIPVATARTFPIPFRVEYKYNKITKGATIIVEAAIHSNKNDRLTWYSTTSTRVITDGYPVNRVRLVVDVIPE